MGAPEQSQDISQLDLAFCVDLTRSMAPFIQAAQRHMSNMLQALSSSAQADLRTAIVGYRDYDATTKPPIEIHPFASRAEDTRRSLMALSVYSSGENTDAAEAVFAGLVASAKSLSWRPRASKIVLLVGDAPPHGCGVSYQPHPDRFPQQDPTGFTVEKMGAFLEEHGLTLYSLSMLPSAIPQHDTLTEQSFSRMSLLTGGEYRRANSSQDAIAIVEAIGKKVFGELEFDRYIFEELTRSGMLTPGAPMPAPAAISEFLSTRVPSLRQEDAASSVARLSKRGILSNPEE